MAVAEIQFLVVKGLRTPVPGWPSVRGHSAASSQATSILATFPHTAYLPSSKPAKEKLLQVESLSWLDSYLKEVSSPFPRVRLIRSDSLKIISLS